jgi:heme/copper-type cytochrome/quinol oxidase subunit 4
MENILKLVHVELFILIAVLYCLGLFLKLNKGFKREYTIPYILYGISLVLCQLYMSIVMDLGFGADIIITSFIQATLIAAVAVFGNELIKQGRVKKYDDVQTIISPKKANDILYK